MLKNIFNSMKNKPIPKLFLSLKLSIFAKANMLNLRYDCTSVLNIELKNSFCRSESLTFLINGLCQNLMRTSVKSMPSKRPIPPKMIVPMFFITFQLYCLSLSSLKSLSEETNKLLNLSKLSSMNLAFMLKNSSKYLKNTYAFGGTLILNFSMVWISCRVFIIPHNKCIENDLHIKSLGNFEEFCLQKYLQADISNH